jgi:cell wall-associated NlpC family hydrolase
MSVCCFLNLLPELTPSVFFDGGGFSLATPASAITAPETKPVDTHAKKLSDAIARYNKENPEMITAVSDSTLRSLLRRGYLPGTPEDWKGFKSNGSLIVDGKIIYAGSAYVPTGSLDASKFGYSLKYQPVFDLVEKFCQSNRRYVLGGAHRWSNGFPVESDCSGFTSSFYQKLAELSGVAPAFPKNSTYPCAVDFSYKYTTKLTGSWPPPNPRDLLKPGDIFVMDKGTGAHGHVGVFMGYDRAGNTLIAHSTTRKTMSETVSGHVGTTGVRIEVLPTRYKSRWKGFYRLTGTDEMLEKLSKS